MSSHKYNIAAVRSYAESHNVSEIMEEFKFPSLAGAYRFLYSHNIKFKLKEPSGRRGRRAIILDFVCARHDCNLCERLGYDFECRNCNESSRCSKFLKSKLSKLFKYDRRCL